MALSQLLTNCYPNTKTQGRFGTEGLANLLQGAGCCCFFVGDRDGHIGVN